MVDMCLFQVENGDVVGICVSGGLDSKTVALRLRLAGVKVSKKGRDESMEWNLVPLIGGIGTI